MTAVNPPVLTSLQNPKVKQLVRLRQARERKQSGLTRVDGARELLRALEAGLVPPVVYTCASRLRSAEAQQALQAALSAGATRQEVSEEVYRRVQYGDRDEGLCACVSWSPRQLETLTTRGTWFLLVLEGVEKPGNLGAVLRTSDAAGVDAVILCDPGLDPTNPNVIRGSMGTLFTMPVAVSDRETLVEFLREQKIAVHAAFVDADTAYTEIAATGPVALVLGAEHEGLTAAWRDVADRALTIPMAGHADSLNLAASAAILLFEVVRQRKA